MEQLLQCAPRLEASHDDVLSGCGRFKGLDVVIAILRAADQHQLPAIQRGSLKCLYEIQLALARIEPTYHQHIASWLQPKGFQRIGCLRGCWHGHTVWDVVHLTLVALAQQIMDGS